MAPLEPAYAGGNGASHNGTAFEQLPSGALAPAMESAPVQQAAPQPSRLDPAYAQKLLGPVPGAEQKRTMHTNLGDEEPKKTAKTDAKVGRNELCPCGSGKKFKRCHGVTA